MPIAIGETPVKRVDLAHSLDAMSEEGKDRRIFLRADRGVPYGELMDVLERLRVGGYSRIALVAWRACRMIVRKRRPRAAADNRYDLDRCSISTSLKACRDRSG